MRIGIVYEYKSDFGILEGNMDYCDFTSPSEINWVVNSIEKAGHNVILIRGYQELLKAICLGTIIFDVLINLSEGFQSRNREGIVPAICEAYNIRYTGTDAYGLSLTLNKHHTKLIVRDLGILVARGELIRPYTSRLAVSEFMAELSKANFEYPIIIKPNHEGSSMGVLLAFNHDEAVSHIIHLFNLYNQEVLCEEYIDGIEMSVPIIGNGNDANVLGIVSFHDLENNKIGLFTTEKKNNNLHIQRSPEIETNLKKKIEEQSLLIHKTLSLRDYSRIDWIITGEGPVFLEVTPLPSFDKGNCFEWCLKEMGLDFSWFFTQLIDFAVKR